MKITNDAITLNNQIYPTKNISSARMVERKSHTFQKGWPYFQRVVTFMAIGIFLAVFGFNAEIEPLLGLAAMIAGVIVFFRGFVRPRTEGKEYGIELLSNSGGMTLFWSRDQEFMIQVRDLIFAALTSSIPSTSTTKRSKIIPSMFWIDRSIMSMTILFIFPSIKVFL